MLIAIAVSSCDNSLDLVPKGQTTLEKTADLELLLNQEYKIDPFPYDDISQICGESVASFMSIPEVMSSTNTLKYAYLSYDESVDRVTLTQSDERYSSIYKYINYFNTILAKIDDSYGLEERKSSIKAEAKVLRAYFHWLLVVIHARQYDAATASELGGIAYVTDIDNTKIKEKKTIEETYRMILEDCSDEVLNALPDHSDDVCRPGKDFGYAVRGKVLMQMKRYEEAVAYFQKSLELNGIVDDRAYIKDTGEWVSERAATSNLLFLGGVSLVNPTTEIITKETDAKFEKNDYVYKYCGKSGKGWDLTYGKMYSGLEGYRMFMGWSVQENPYGITSVRIRLALAECLIRSGEIRKGLEQTDIVRKCHIESYTPYTRMYDLAPLTEKAAMRLIQQTKWIENLGSYENFFDMKRWNSEEDYKTEIKKDLGEYGIKTLSPDSPLWVLPFPANATRYNSTLTQNF